MACPRSRPSVAVDSDLDTEDEIYQEEEDEQQDSDEEEEDHDPGKSRDFEDLSLGSILLEYFAEEYKVSDYWAIVLFSLFQKQVSFPQLMILVYA